MPDITDAIRLMNEISRENPEVPVSKLGLLLGTAWAAGLEMAASRIGIAIEPSALASPEFWAEQEGQTLNESWWNSLSDESRAAILALAPE